MSVSTILLIVSIGLNAVAYSCYLIAKLLEKIKVSKAVKNAERTEKERVQRLKDELYKDYLKTINKGK